MVSLSAVKSSIEAHLSEAQVFVKDLTGGGDHLEATVVSPDFAGQSRVRQHQMVYAALKEDLATEAIHALALRTFTPDKWAEADQSI
ncbi:BolA family protein [[Synechococcus] sp. NIES-970]|nr:BolA family protein [[Synechococcus] sp. NIES-970]